MTGSRKKQEWDEEIDEGNRGSEGTLQNSTGDLRAESLEDSRARDSMGVMVREVVLNKTEYTEFIKKLGGTGAEPVRARINIHGTKKFPVKANSQSTARLCTYSIIFN